MKEHHQALACLRRYLAKKFVIVKRTANYLYNTFFIKFCKLKRALAIIAKARSFQNPISKI
jgi:hypothetical protein